MMYDLFGNPVTTAQKCKVTRQSGGLLVATPYNARFVALVKGLPAGARRFEPDAKAWLVDTQYAKQVRQWILDCYGEDIGDITISTNPQQLETRVLDMWYLGRTKTGGDEPSASGMNAAKEWRMVFPERVLREWFEGEVGLPSAGITLYGLLGVSRVAEADELRSAYRRMARQWHPDVCRETNAGETFLRIQQAYEILTHPMKRARYDAGLALEAACAGMADDASMGTGYRAPLRCGYVLAEGHDQLGRFVVRKILHWEDITSDRGTLVASWPAGGKEPVWQWV